MTPSFDRIEFKGLDPASQTLASLLRGTVLMASILGALAIFAALALGQPLTSIGLLIGLVISWLNLRAMDSAIGKVEINPDEEMKVLRKRIRGGVLTRLAVVTGVVLVFVILNRPLGFGVVLGLVVFQLCFVINVGRAIASSGGSE